MARMDMVCKVLAPIVISGFLYLVPSIMFGVVAIALTIMVSLFVGLWTARRLWDQCSMLREPKQPLIAYYDSDGEATHYGHSIQSQNPLLGDWLACIAAWYQGYIPSLCLFFASEICLPMPAMCIINASDLPVSGPLIVSLLNSGYSLQEVEVQS
jgi:iron-regulated transporter 1